MEPLAGRAVDEVGVPALQLDLPLGPTGEDGPAVRVLQGLAAMVARPGRGQERVDGLDAPSASARRSGPGRAASRCRGARAACRAGGSASRAAARSWGGSKSAASRVSSSEFSSAVSISVPPMSLLGDNIRSFRHLFFSSRASGGSTTGAACPASLRRVVGGASPPVRLGRTRPAGGQAVRPPAYRLTTPGAACGRGAVPAGGPPSGRATPWQSSHTSHQSAPSPHGRSKPGSMPALIQSTLRRRPGATGTARDASRAHAATGIARRVN